MNRKGIILAGGSGSRLYPLTKVISKQLLPIYNKPMIYYPISNLIMSRIKEILIISSPHHIKLYKNLLGNGENLGLKFSYKIQKKPNGIAEGLILAEKFLKGSNLCLILGDNIFFGKDIKKKFLNASNSESQSIFGKKVNHPNKYGVLKFKNGKVNKIIEKPKSLVSKYAVTGIYFYNNSAIEIAKKLKPSYRNELEITDLNNQILNKNELNIHLLNNEQYWYDAGNHSDYVKTINHVYNYENEKQLVGCLEIEAFKSSFISKKKLLKYIDNKSPFYKKLKNIL